MKKTIFITGASSGIGKETAKLFADKGWNVWATMRKPENETSLNSLENVHLLQLDVTDTKQIKEIVQHVLGKGHVDVVFNNAGYALMGALEAISDEQLVSQMETNFLGVVRVTKAFIPYFRRRKAGLFITTGSLAGLIGFPVGSIYDASKWAIEGWSESLSYELAQYNIGIKTIEPGLVTTSINDKSPVATHEAYEKMLNSFFSIIGQAKEISTAEQIAQVVFKAATDGTKKLRYLGGQDAKSMYAQRLAVGDEAFREGIQQMITEGSFFTK